ncbi:MAG: CooT family nickel-binding protein [Actinomycetota bacterium]|nr:CooT family nickel-binding protein [Actinomycetota bacterium]
MCESNVYISEEGERNLFMEDAVLIESVPGGYKFKNILGEEKEIKGEIEEISFLEHRITIAR